MWLHRAVAGCLAVTLLLSACSTGWRRIPVEDSLALSRHQMAQVWRAGHVSRMYGLVVLADSLRGIPFPRPLDCDSCRVVVPRAEVDSIRVGNSDASLSRLVLTAGFVAALAYVFICWRASSCPQTTDASPASDWRVPEAVEPPGGTLRAAMDSWSPGA